MSKHQRFEEMLTLNFLYLLDETARISEPYNEQFYLEQYIKV